MTFLTWYSVTSWAPQPSTMSTTLQVVLANSSEIVSNFNLTYGTTGTPAPASRLSKRSSSSTVITIDTSDFEDWYDDFSGFINSGSETEDNAAFQCRDCGLFAQVTFSGGATVSL